MTKSIFAIALFGVLVTLALAQNSNSMPPISLAGNAAARSMPKEMTLASPDRAPGAKSGKLFFCPPKTCLYYAGDNDTSNPNNNGLWDFYNPGIFCYSGTWVGMKPNTAVVVTGSSGNYYTNAVAIGVNPTPFSIQTGPTGQGGTTVCKTSGNATMKAYGEGYSGFSSENYYIKNLATACKLPKLHKGNSYYVLLTPQYNDQTTVGYLEDVEDAKPANHRGWNNDVDDSYFFCSCCFFSNNWTPTWGNSGACGGTGCDEFSISLTGKE